MLILKHFFSSQVFSYNLNRPILVGSTEGNDIRIVGNNVPDVALRIQPDFGNPTQSHITVFSSSVKINGKKSKATLVLPGDRIEIGESVFGVDLLDSNVGQSTQLIDKTLQNFAEFSQSISKEFDLAKFLIEMIRHLAQLFDATDGFMLKLDQLGALQIAVSSENQDVSSRFSDTIVQRTIQTRQGVFVENALTNPEFSQTDSIVNLGLKSVLCVPVLFNGKISGVIYLGSNKPVVSFSENNLSILSICATLAGVFIDQIEYICKQEQTIIQLKEHVRYEGIIGESKAIKDVLSSADSIAASDITVLIEGETGTGKDLLAQMIHSRSNRNTKPFIVVNCSSIKGELFESELFGHKKGSFTGALKEHRGLFTAAHGGTLFLDEIGELPLELQSKLLRTLETGKIRPVGSSTEETVDVRIICATNRELKEMAEKNIFRKDLFYRLSQFRLLLPPLRERGEDAILLAYHILEKYKAKYPDRKGLEFHPDTVKTILSYNWPGNIRELASVIHTSVLTAQGSIIIINSLTSSKPVLNLDEATKEFQLGLIRQAINVSSGNKDEAAKLLGIHRSTLFRYLAQYSI